MPSSDILLYNTTHIPVGDQLQHIELTRDVALHFNKQYNTDVFTIPEPILINNTHNRIMSLKDATQLMSKSDINDNTRINLTDTDDQIAQKIKRCKTDSVVGLLTYAIINRPDISNLLNIYSLLTNQSVAQVVQDTQYNTSKQKFKQALTEQLINTISPIRQKIHEYKSDISYIKSVWKSGTEHTNTIAQHYIDQRYYWITKKDMVILLISIVYIHQSL